MAPAEPTPPAPTGDLAPAAGTTSPATSPRGLWAKVRHLVVHNILHLDDTPHRIAFGVFLGFLVGATPTIGIQMVVYVALAALLGANKVSGILPVWLSNPITAVPLFYGNWRIGRFLMRGEADVDGAGRALIEQVINLPGAELPLHERLFDAAFWSAAMDAFVSMGAELWVGSVFVGVVSGALAYWATYKAVQGYRRRHPHPPV
jgi:uncharacterized protein (DUF2062 family)